MEADEWAKAAGVRFKQARQDASLTQSELGRTSGVGQSNISHFEKGTKALGLGAFLRLLRAGYERGLNVQFVVLGPAAAQPQPTTIETSAKARSAAAKARRDQLRSEDADEAAWGIKKTKRSGAR